jgi:hypothetical protein
MKLYHSILVVILFTAGCSNHEDKIVKQLPGLKYGFEKDLNEWIELGGSGERKFDADIAISSDLAYEGSGSVKFRVTPESYVGKGTRAELTFDQGAVAGDESWYSWSFYLPETYQDVPLEDSTGAPNWQVMGQWHHQPDVSKGETWDDYPQQGKSVPLLINYHYLSDQDPAYQALKQDPRTLALFGFDPTWSEVSVIALGVGDPPVSVAIARIEKGRWNHLKLHINWSEQEDGFVQAWLNDQPFTNGRHYGQNMLNKVSHYFKFGLYRNPTIPFTHKLFYDQVEIR